MTDVPLDAETARVWIGGGAKWQDVLDVVTPHGLAPLVGSTPDVSAVGYTLGGGLVRGAYDGPMEEGERHLTLWRDWETPEFDLFGPMTFDRIAEISMDPPDPLPAEVTGAWMASLSDETIDELVDRTFPQDGPPLILFTEMRHAGVARSPAAGTWPPPTETARRRSCSRSWRSPPPAR